LRAARFARALSFCKGDAHRAYRMTPPRTIPGTHLAACAHWVLHCTCAAITGFSRAHLGELTHLARLPRFAEHAAGAILVHVSAAAVWTHARSYRTVDVLRCLVPLHSVHIKSVSGARARRQSFGRAWACAPARVRCFARRYTERATCAYCAYAGTRHVRLMFTVVHRAFCISRRLSLLRDQAVGSVDKHRASYDRTTSSVAAFCAQCLLRMLRCVFAARDRCVGACCASGGLRRATRGFDRLPLRKSFARRGTSRARERARAVAHARISHFHARIPHTVAPHALRVTSTNNVRIERTAAAQSSARRFDRRALFASGTRAREQASINVGTIALRASFSRIIICCASLRISARIDNFSSSSGRACYSRTAPFCLPAGTCLLPRLLHASRARRLHYTRCAPPAVNATSFYLLPVFHIT